MNEQEKIIYWYDYLFTYVHIKYCMKKQTDCNLLRYVLALTNTAFLQLYNRSNRATYVEEQGELLEYVRSTAIIEENLQLD